MNLNNSLNSSYEKSDDYERAQAEKLEALRRDIAIGIKELKEGKGTPLNMAQIIQECHEEYNKKNKNVHTDKSSSR